LTNRIDSTAIIHSSAKIGNNVRIGHFVTIGQNVSIGDDAIIEHGARIYEDCIIGNQTPYLVLARYQKEITR
jgi:UDP-3-O-[3-hydroxymyristoyl] glucosamine N-acyltransferase